MDWKNMTIYIYIIYNFYLFFSDPFPADGGKEESQIWESGNISFWLKYLMYSHTSAYMDETV